MPTINQYAVVSITVDQRISPWFPNEHAAKMFLSHLPATAQGQFRIASRDVGTPDPTEGNLPSTQSAASYIRRKLAQLHSSEEI